MSVAVMRRLYFTLVYPFLTYGIEICGHSSVTQLLRLNSQLVKTVIINAKKHIRRESHIKINGF